MIIVSDRSYNWLHLYQNLIPIVIGISIISIIISKVFLYLTNINSIQIKGLCNY